MTTLLAERWFPEGRSAGNAATWAVFGQAEWSAEHGLAVTLWYEGPELDVSFAEAPKESSRMWQACDPEADWRLCSARAWRLWDEWCGSVLEAIHRRRDSTEGRTGASPAKTFEAP